MAKRKRDFENTVIADLGPERARALRAEAERDKRPLAHYVRHGIDLALAEIKAERARVEAALAAVAS